MRVVHSVRLAIFVAALAAAMALGAASASAFSLSSSTATTQAGAPTDLSFTYSATGSQSLSRLDVDLPPGVMHDPSSLAKCPVSDFQVDRCRTPRVGHTSTRINIAGFNVSVSGDIHALSDPADDSDLSLGIVLRPPFSALGLTGKIYLRDRVSFTDGGGLRHSITGPLSSVSVLGLPLRSRLSQMRVTFSGQSSTANQLYNSTSCASHPLRATGIFSDGSNENRTAPYSTTGCDRLIFTGGIEFRTGVTGTPKTSFGTKLRSGHRSPAGVTHEYHLVGTDVDLSEVGDWDTLELANEPGCSESEFISNTCPVRSQLGTVTAEIEGFPGTRSGAIFNSHPRGAKPRGRIELRPGVTATFSLDFVTDADGSSSLEIDGLPQLPLTDLSIDVSSPVFVPKGKPASCSNREARAVLSGHSGGWSLASQAFPAEPCPPEASFADAGDADADGDGWADSSLKPENFHVWYSVKNGGNGVDPGSLRCELESPKPELAVRGKVKSVKDTGSGYVGCEVSEAAGDVTVVFSVASIDGHVTVLKSSYNVDSEAPVLSSVAPEPMELDSTQVELPFEFTDDRIDHPQSDYVVECAITDSDDQRTTTPGHKYIDTLTLRGGGTCQWDTGMSGRFALEVSLTDGGGHVTVLKRSAVVDADGPVITLTDTRDQDDDGDGLPTEALRLSNFDVPFSVSDDSGDPVTVSCKLINPIAMDKDLRVHDLDGDGAPEVCRVAEAPGGPITVEISAVDWRGHVTVLKLSYTVDTDPPLITTAPDKVVYDLPSFDVEFEFTDDTLTHPQSEFTAEVALSTGQVSSAKVIVDRDSGRSKGFGIFENVPDGTHEMRIKVRDKVGHVTLIKRTIKVDTEGPVITTDEDSDGDGVIDKQFLPSNFKAPFRLLDASEIDPASVSCTVQGWDYTGKTRLAVADLDGDGLGDACEITDAPPGPFDLEISAADVHGHVTVLKLSGEVEEPMAQVEILSPSEGQSFGYSGTMNPVFTIAGPGPYTFSCMIDSTVVAASCPSGTPINLAGVPAGPHVLTVTARDSSGRASTDTVSFVILSPPPPPSGTVCPLYPSAIPGCPNGPVVCVAIYPPPAGCPGGPPTTACPPPPNVNPPIGCGVYGTIPGGTITLP